ncbi:hypothetical protein FE257_000686 [Aspergillus nanangensis]|uniref:Uncharacterized protein n=1 Tax=Aspergillus nanangensis TaxID=2582783 RepID=A0AAD4GQ71_ASPNN|nr:hypothetical protein FE257_000686 [Aspergillus nanangensis]
MEGLSPTALTNLPVEILFLIAYHTRSYSAISALTRSTRRLHDVLNPYLYRLNVRQADGGYALCWAARYGNSATLRLALENRSGLVSSRPLLIAARFGHCEIVRNLLAVGDAGLQSRDNEGNTALVRAIAAGHEEMVKILLDAGALPDPHTSHRSYQSHARSALFAAIELGNMFIVEQLLACGRINVKGKYRDHHTTLSLSAQRGHSELVKLFLDLGVPVNTRHSGGHTPLTYGIKSGSADVVRMLLNSGADPNSLHSPYQNTPIFFAVWSRKTIEPVIQALVEDPRIDVNRVNEAGQSPLAFALRLWNRAVPYAKFYPLDPCHWRCSDEKVTIISSQNDLEPNTGNEFAKAIYYNRLSIAERIFANPRLTRESKFKGLQKAITCRCRTPEPACDAMFGPLFECFLAECRDLNEPVFDGMSLLMFACLHRHERAVNLLLEHGVHPESRAYANGDVAVHYPSPLHCAIRGGCDRIFRRLLQTEKVDLNCPAGPFGLDAFLSAVQGGNTSIVGVLRDMTDIDPNVTDARGMCAVAIVAKHRGSTCLMQELLQWDGVDANMVDNTGKSALNYARELGYKDLEYMLRQHLYGFVPLPEPKFELFPVRRIRARGRKSRNGKKG